MQKLISMMEFHQRLNRIANPVNIPQYLYSPQITELMELSGRMSQLIQPYQHTEHFTQLMAKYDFNKIGKLLEKQQQIMKIAGQLPAYTVDRPISQRDSKALDEIYSSLSVIADEASLKCGGVKNPEMIPERESSPKNLRDLFAYILMLLSFMMNIATFYNDVTNHDVSDILQKLENHLIELQAIESLEVEILKQISDQLEAESSLDPIK